MSEDRGSAEYRKWALDVLSLLAAPPERQAAHLRELDVDSDELLLEFDDLLHVTRARVADGSLAQEDLDVLLEVNGKADSVNSGPDSIWESSALETASEWGELRAAAKTAVVHFESA